MVVVLAGEFLHNAEELLQIGLHPSEIISGYEKAGKKAIEILDGKRIKKDYNNNINKFFNSKIL